MACRRSFSPQVTRAWSKTTESQPPERPTESRSDGALRVARKAPTRAGSSLGRLFLVAAIAHQPLVAGRQQFVRGQPGKLLERLLQGLLEVLCHGSMIAVGAAERFANHLIDQAQGFQALGRDTHGFSGFRCLLGALPQNGGAAFRRND